MTDIEKVFKFMDKMNMRTGHVSNVYVAKTYTSDGVCIDEKYGMNLLTDYGFQQFFGVDGTPTFPKKLYVGEGTSSFDKTTNIMTAVLFNGLMATDKQQPIDYQYPLYFSPGDQDTSGRITAIMKYMVGEYSENIEGVSSDVAITEYGIGDNWNQLWTHSFVYDSQGDRASITKSPGTRLTIDVYMCCSFLESLITDGYINSSYTLITSAYMLMNRMDIPTVSTFKRDAYDGSNGKTNRTIYSRSRSAVINSTITKSLIMDEIILSPNTSDEYIDGFSCEADGFLVLQPQQLTESESITTSSWRSHNPFDQNGFADTIGRDVPFTQMDVTSVNSFNYKTGNWDNAIYYNNSSTHIFDETTMSSTYAKPMIYMNNSNKETLYVYQNINPLDPILQIRGNVQTLYATDKYWFGLNIPGNDWIQITNRSSIPVNAQSKRYWITNTNNVSLDPVRQGTFYLKIDASSSGYQNTPSAYSNLHHRSGFFTIDNTDYEVSISYGSLDGEIQLFSLSGNRVETLSTTGYAFTYGKWVFTTNNTTGYLYDISALSQGTLNAPTTLTLTAGGNMRQYSTNGNGLLCISSGDNNCLDIINFTTPSVGISSLSNITIGCIMWNTTRVAYINNDSTKLIIYDIPTTTNLYEFTLPAELDTQIYYIMAYTNHVFILTETQTFICDIRTGTFIESAVTIPIHTVSGPLYKCVSNMLITYGNQQAGYTDNVTCISLIDSTPVIRVINQQQIDPTYGSQYYNFIGTQLVEVGNSLCMLTISIRNDSNYSWYYRFIDIGQYVHSGIWDSSLYATHAVDAYVRGFIYDKHFVLDSKMSPLINFLPIKLTGTTKTITAINHIKSISNKEFAISFSNTPTFYGKPPGSLN